MSVLEHSGKIRKSLVNGNNLLIYKLILGSRNDLKFKIRQRQRSILYQILSVFYVGATRTFFNLFVSKIAIFDIKTHPAVVIG